MLDETLPDVPGTGVRGPAESEFGTRRPRRRRIVLNCTIHPETLDRLDKLAVRFESHRGQVLDKVIAILAAAYDSGKVLCIHGQTCIAGRTDLPGIY